MSKGNSLIQIGSFALWCAFSLAPHAVYAATIDVLVGDKNGFGFSPACPDTGSCPALNSPSIDNRTAAEMAATNGSQYTDVYSSLFPGSGPNGTTTGSILFPFIGLLTSGTVSVAAGDFQADVFGSLLANINGVSVPFSFADGRFVTVIHSFTLTAAELAAANTAGQVTLNLDRNASNDFVAFDYFELNGVTNSGTVPEPSTLALLGGALAGLCYLRRRERA